MDDQAKNDPILWDSRRSAVNSTDLDQIYCISVTRKTNRYLSNTKKMFD